MRKEKKAVHYSPTTEELSMEDDSAPTSTIGVWVKKVIDYPKDPAAVVFWVDMGKSLEQLPSLPTLPPLGRGLLKYELQYDLLSTLSSDLLKLSTEEPFLSPPPTLPFGEDKQDEKPR